MFREPLKWIYATLGMLFLILSYFGIIMPGVPAIPFIFLAAFFFTFSSKKLYNVMLRQRLIGNVLRAFSSARSKRRYVLFVISQLWVSIIVALILFVKHTEMILLLIAAGIIFSLLLYRLMMRTDLKAPSDDAEN